MAEGHSLLNAKYKWLDRGLFGGVILGELLTCVELFRRVVGFNEITALIIFIVLNTVVWTVFIMRFTLSLKKDQDFYKTQNLLLAEALKKEAGYKHGYQPVGMAFAEIHELHRIFDGLPEDKPIDESVFIQLRCVCDNIARGFEKITNTEGISVCIKLVREADENTIVKTIVRDSVYTHRRTIEKDVRHLRLQDDTALNDIFRKHRESPLPEERYYLCNDLPQEPHFKSSNFHRYHQQDWNSNLSAEIREKVWALPYQSTMVGCIFPTADKTFTLDGPQNPLIGYICIDSPHKNTFQAGVDNIILTGMGDGLYNMVRRLKDATVVTATDKAKSSLQEFKP